MNRREYAISLGLAKPGRGRLSREAHAAIAKAESAGTVFSDSPKSAPAIVEQVIVEGQVTEPVKAKPPQQKRRDDKSYTLTTTAGQIIRFEHCYRCKQHVMYCRCQPEPVYPDWLAAEVDTWEPTAVG